MKTGKKVLRTKNRECINRDLQDLQEPTQTRKFYQADYKQEKRWTGQIIREIKGGEYCNTTGPSRRRRKTVPTRGENRGTVEKLKND